MHKNNKKFREDALRYHSQGRPGKIEVIPTKPYSSQNDLSLAYSPGVAEPCLEIEKNPEDAYKYTAKGNLVAVISNGTAVLGLGNIGAIAGKPVMEGKALLFKTFADIDVFDIEVDTTDVDQFVQTVKNIAPTFGGINLEDIKAPECFIIEERLKNELNIPVMHDDQHGTAIISSAAMLNALEITGKDVSQIKVVVNGAGAAAISCSKLYLMLGVKLDNMVMCDSKGVITVRRTDLNKAKLAFATDRNIDTLEQALEGADLFLGLSVADVLTTKMIRSMASDPIVFALANPNPEISYQEAMKSRTDIIFATGRSDHPNQVNNVLGFPYIFRGALDVRATAINEQMKIAAAKSLAALAKQPVPDTVRMAYNIDHLSFGRDYIIPKPLDPRLISHITIAVARAAIESGVARHKIEDWDAYSFELESRMGRADKLLRAIRTKVLTTAAKRIAFSDGDKLPFIQTAANLIADKLAHPILVGDRTTIERLAWDNHIELEGIEIIDFADASQSPRCNRYAAALHSKLSHNGITPAQALRYMENKDWFTSMMVFSGDADTSILGYSRRYTEVLEPVIEIFMPQSLNILASMVIVSTKKGHMFFADTAVNSNPNADELAEITRLTADMVRRLGKDPVVAMLSHSNFGTDTNWEASKVAQAVEILHKEHPDMIVDGEMKVDTALDRSMREHNYPFSTLVGRDVNTFIFPDLSAANISYKLMESLGGAEITGPILLGTRGVHPVSDRASLRSLLNLSMIAVALTH